MVAVVGVGMVVVAREQVAMEAGLTVGAAMAVVKVVRAAAGAAMETVAKGSARTRNLEHRSWGTCREGTGRSGRRWRDIGSHKPNQRVQGRPRCRLPAEVVRAAAGAAMETVEAAKESARTRNLEHRSRGKCREGTGRSGRRWRGTGSHKPNQRVQDISQCKLPVEVVMEPAEVVMEAAVATETAEAAKGSARTRNLEHRSRGKSREETDRLGIRRRGTDSHKGYQTAQGRLRCKSLFAILVQKDTTSSHSQRGVRGHCANDRCVWSLVDRRAWGLVRSLCLRSAGQPARTRSSLENFQPPWKRVRFKIRKAIG